MKATAPLVVFLFLSISSPSSAQADAESGGQFMARELSLDGEAYRYQVWLPPGYSAERQWPVILYLHGARERGNDGRKQTRTGLGSALVDYPDRYPFVVVLPQAHKKTTWMDPPMMDQALEALDRSVEEFSGDSGNVFLTGLSLGGVGTWYLTARHPERFAAIAPVCGAISDPRAGVPDEERFDHIAGLVAGTPAWVFHGNRDRRIPVGHSRGMVEALREMGSDVRYTEYEGVGHNSWDLAYSDPELPQWMLQVSGASSAY